MARRTTRAWVRALVGACVASLVPACGAERERSSDDPAPPHVLLIVTDDLGWADVGYHGGEVRTPHIDRLAAEGIELDRFYVSPICSATRAALMTGRYPIRYGLARAVITPWRDYGLDTRELTLGEVLATAGYEHRAVFGKWHLGHLDSRWHPLEQGFTRFRGHYTGAIDYFSHEREGQRDWHDDREPLREHGYSTDLIAEAASRFLEQHAQEGPLLCYVAFNAPHAPFQVPDEYLERHEEPGEEGAGPDRRRVRTAMIECLDDGIGRILAALERAGIEDDTLVWFLSDNGAGPEVEGCNRPLRGTKATLFEGGIRVPAAVRWPSRLPGGRRCTTPLAAIDVLPTLMQACGLERHGGEPLDGVGALEILARDADAPERELYFHYGQEGPADEQLAILTPRWKLLIQGPDLAAHRVGHEHVRLLFDIVADPHETTDVAAGNPVVVEELTRRLIAYRKLQPPDPIPPFWEGREGFVPPADWDIEDP